MTEIVDTNKILTFKEQLVLEQLRQQFKESQAAFNTLDTKAMNVVSVSSIVITIVIGFRLAGTQSAQSVDSGLLAIAGLYVLTIILAFMCLLPKNYSHEPLKPEWSAIHDALVEEDDVLYYSLLSGYEDVINRNLHINADKAQYVKLAFISLVVTVVVALLIAIF